MNKNKINLLKYDSVLFDLGGVILNLDYDLTVNAFKSLGQERFDNLYTQASQDFIFDKFETGIISSIEFIDYMLSLLPKECSSADVVIAWNLMLLDLPKKRIDFLKQLSLKMPINLFSNTNDLHFKSFTKYFINEFGDENLLNSMFNKCYYSHLVGERKPNSAAFQLVLDEQGLDPEKVLFIDDSIQHIEGANKLGIKTHHLVDSDICDILTFS
ncbi:MAG: FMN phosphatase YigB (HAD superfamily) [Arenicella sp.]|jgi:FMN phosphatase YigB (HAD superfamily)